MKGFRSTGVTTLIVALIAGFTVWEYRKAQDEGRISEGERAVITYSPEQATELIIDRPTERIHLQKDAKGAWRMSEPAEDLAEVAVVESYIFQLLAARLRVFSEEGDANKAAIDWAAYGLAPPAATIEVVGPSGPQSIQISSKNAFDGSFFVRQKDELFAGDAGLVQLRDKPSTAFRSRHIWREGDIAVDKVEVRLGKDSYVLQKKDGNWTIDPKVSFEIDGNKIDSWIDQIRTFTPADFARETLDEQARKEFLLAKPSATIAVNGDWQVTFGQNLSEDVYVHTNKRGTVYKTTVTAANQLRVPKEYFRNGRKAFQFEVEKIRNVEIRTPKLNATLKKSDSNWVLENPKDGEELDQTKLADLFGKIRNFDALEFVGNPPNSGIGAPQVVLRDEKGNELFTLAWGGEFKGNLRFVRTNLEKEIVGVAKEKVDNLIDPQLIQTKMARPEKK